MIQEITQNLTKDPKMADQKMIPKMLIKKIVNVFRLIQSPKLYRNLKIFLPILYILFKDLNYIKYIDFKKKFNVQTKLYIK